jgi:hypothetical protein
MKYFNHDEIVAKGLDPNPKHDDVVAWVENGEYWSVNKEDDLEGTSALHHWPDGGWCNVRLARRGSEEIL